MMYSFPAAAVTNRQTRGGFEQLTFLISRAWRSGLQNGAHWAQIKMSTGPEAAGENPFSGVSSSVSRGHPHSIVRRVRPLMRHRSGTKLPSYKAQDPVITPSLAPAPANPG